MGPEPENTSSTVAPSRVEVKTMSRIISTGFSAG